MCQAILQGLRQYLDNTGRRTKGANAVLPTEALEEEHLEEACCIDASVIGAAGPAPVETPDEQTPLVTAWELQYESLTILRFGKLAVNWKGDCVLRMRVT